MVQYVTDSGLILHGQLSEDLLQRLDPIRLVEIAKLVERLHQLRVVQVGEERLGQFPEVRL